MDTLPSTRASHVSAFLKFSCQEKINTFCCTFHGLWLPNETGINLIIKSYICDHVNCSNLLLAQALLITSRKQSRVYFKKWNNLITQQRENVVITNCLLAETNRSRYLSVISSASQLSDESNKALDKAILLLNLVQIFSEQTDVSVGVTYELNFITNWLQTWNFPMEYFHAFAQLPRGDDKLLPHLARGFTFTCPRNESSSFISPHIGK